MKKRFLKTLFSLGIFVLFCLSLLITFLLSPSLLYAHQTTYENITNYHNTPLDENLRVIIDLSLSNIESAAIYQEHFKSDLEARRGEDQQNPTDCRQEHAQGQTSGVEGGRGREPRDQRKLDHPNNSSQKGPLAEPGEHVR